MKYSKTILIMFIVFLGSMLLLFLLSYISYLQGKFYIEELGEIIVNITKIYSIHISILFTGSFFTGLEDKQRLVSDKVAIVSLGLSGIWNVMLLISLFVFLNISPPDDFQKIITFQNQLADASSFIITGVLSFFFVSKPKE